MCERVRRNWESLSDAARTSVIRAGTYSRRDAEYVGEGATDRRPAISASPLSHRIRGTRWCNAACTGSGDIYVTVKGVKRSGKVSRATIGRRLPWFRHPPINAPKQLSPNPDRTETFSVRSFICINAISVRCAVSWERVHRDALTHCQTEIASILLKDW